MRLVLFGIRYSVAGPRLVVMGVGVGGGRGSFLPDLQTFLPFVTFLFFLPQIRGTGPKSPSSRSVSGMEKHTF